MRKANILKIISVFTLCFFVLSGCSMFGSAEKPKKEESAKLDETFVSEVSLVCTSIEESAIEALKSNFSLSDPDFFNKTLSDAEESYDKIIAGMTAIDPDETIEEDWQTMIDDFTAIRDSFPELSNVLNQLARLDATKSTELDPKIYEENQVKIDSLQKQYEMLNRGNTQRVTAIADFAKEHDFEGCDSL